MYHSLEFADQFKLNHVSTTVRGPPGEKLNLDTIEGIN
jgi:hypothetical protein